MAENMQNNFSLIQIQDTFADLLFYGHLNAALHIQTEFQTLIANINSVKAR
jgi:hypothetical protein